MKAEATAENRPACDGSARAHQRTIDKTHEDQGRVQILVILLRELPVVLLGLLVVVLTESSLVILLSEQCVLFPVARGF